MAERSWDALDEYRGKMFTGEWPTIPEMFEMTVSRYPDEPCFTVFEPDRITLTYAEAARIVHGVAGYLLAQGITPGKKVALTGKNSPQWTIAYLAILHCGGIIVPIDYQLPAERIASLIEFSDAALYFTDREKAQGLQGALTPKGIPMLSLEPQGSAPYIYDLSLAAEPLVVPSAADEEALAAILFTSGTTGNEKGVMLTHKNFITDVYQACDPAYMTATEQDVFYALLPLHHSYAMTAVFLESIKHGCELIFARNFSIKKIISDLQTGKVTVFMGIPMLYNKLLAGVMKKVRAKGILVYAVIRVLMVINGVLKKHLGLNPGKSFFFKSILEGLGFSRMNFCISGGGPLPAKTFHQFQQLGLDFVQGYGLTETSPIVTLNPRHHFKITSVGKILPFIEVRIDSPDEAGVGEIQVKGPNVTSGYYKDPDHTAELFTEDGYLKTGDLGYVDGEGYLFLCGRRKNLIVTEGGKNVYPEEIEDAFQLSTEIEQIMVRGYISDIETAAEGIEAVIFPNLEFFGDKAEDSLHIRDAIEQAVHEVNKKFPAYKKITKVTILEEPMDMTSTKKIQRNKVS